MTERLYYSRGQLRAEDSRGDLDDGRPRVRSHCRLEIEAPNMLVSVL
jgi:hypothetical protein